MNEIQIFQNDMFGEVRTLQDENGKLLFSGSDVAKVLGYAIPTKAINTHCKGVSKMEVPTTSGNQTMIFIPEGDIYRLVIKSKLPLADKFESWIFDTVVPNVMKHGAYMTPQTLEQAILNPTFLKQLATQLETEQAERQRLATANEVLTVEVQAKQLALEEVQPKTAYYDLVLNSKDLISTTIIAKDYGWSAVKLNKFLNEKKVQYQSKTKSNKVWLLYQKYSNEGYTGTKTTDYLGSDGDIHTNQHTYWTQKGRLFIYDLLKSNDILPTMEREQSVIEIVQ